MSDHRYVLIIRRTEGRPSFWKARCSASDHEGIHILGGFLPTGRSIFLRSPYPYNQQHCITACNLRIIMKVLFSLLAVTVASASAAVPCSGGIVGAAVPLMKDYAPAQQYCSAKYPPATVKITAAAKAKRATTTTRRSSTTTTRPTTSSQDSKASQWSSLLSQASSHHLKCLCVHRDTGNDYSNSSEDTLPTIQPLTSYRFTLPIPQLPAQRHRRLLPRRHLPRHPPYP